MFRVVVLAIAFIFILNYVANLGYATNVSYSKTSAIYISASSSVQCGGCHSSSNGHHDENPFNLHVCIGHCHSSHEIPLMLNEYELDKVALGLQGPSLHYINFYKSVDLDNLFRPPVFS